GLFSLGRSVFQSRLFRFFLLYAGLIFAVTGEGFFYCLYYKLFYFVYNILPEQSVGFFGGRVLAADWGVGRNEVRP
ncbi:MAG: hypothetical protein LBB47_02550, partial [Spirochaetaceae bacterium]|nr:hypothetical protein [Spirochaetaceae bacterium]